MDNDTRTEHHMTTSVIQLVGPDHGVALEQMLLKTGMVLPGAKSAEHADAGLVAQATLRSLQASVPAAVSGVVFYPAGKVNRRQLNG